MKLFQKPFYMVNIYYKGFGWEAVADYTVDTNFEQIAACDYITDALYDKKDFSVWLINPDCAPEDVTQDVIDFRLDEFYQTYSGSIDFVPEWVRNHGGAGFDEWLDEYTSQSINNQAKSDFLKSIL